MFLTFAGRTLVEQQIKGLQDKEQSRIGLGLLEGALQGIEQAK